MAFKPVNTRIIDLKKHKGQPFVGTYIGKKTKAGQFGEEVIWQFVDEDEAAFEVYGFTMFSRQMELLKPGALCRITYTGTEKVQTKKYGVKDIHQALVEVDRDESKKPDLVEQTFEDGTPVPQEIPF